MDLLIFFAVVFATIVLAIVLERIIHCPVLVGFAFFSIFLLIAVIQADTTLVIISIVLGIIAFIAAFLYCLIRNSNISINNNCFNCNCNGNNNNNNNNNNGINANENLLNTINNDTDTINISNCGGYNRYYRNGRY